MSTAWPALAITAQVYTILSECFHKRWKDRKSQYFLPKLTTELTAHSILIEEGWLFNSSYKELITIKSMQRFKLWEEVHLPTSSTIFFFFLMKHTHPRQGIQGKIDLLPTIQEKETVQLPLCMNSHFCTELEPECHIRIFPTCKHCRKYKC